MKNILLLIALTFSLITSAQIVSDTAITTTDSVIFIHGTIRKPIIAQSNIPPTANAGADKSVTLPVSTVQLVGTAIDVDGSITKYLWAKVSGTGGIISTPTVATTNVTGLTAGTYVFSLTVTDNGNATATDNIIVIVNPAPPNNQSPTANAGTDKALTLPTNSIDISGSGTDADGTIAAYVWTKVTGPSTFTLANSNTATVRVTNMIAGTYVFRLTVTDNQGASGTDDVSVIVSPPVVLPPVLGAIQGYGSQATGGAGMQTVHVTTTASSGTGSLSSLIGSNRTIVFDVSGTINGGLNVSGQNITIDAYSSKQDITINGGSDGMNVTGSNIIIRGIRFTNCSNDGLNATGSANSVVFDHCSSYGNGDGNIDIAATASGGRNFTVQYCFLGNNNGSGLMLITSQNASIHHNLFAGGSSGEGAERNPFAHSNYSPPGSTTSPNFDFRNNLITSSGRYASGNGYNAVGNYVNNYYTSTKSCLINLCADNASCGKAYVSGNFNQSSSCGGTPQSTEYQIPSQYQVATTDAKTAAQAVLQQVGTWQKNSYEQGVINGISISGSNPPPATACTGYTYSAWSACNNGVQTRTVTGTTPSGCTGQPTSAPVLSQSCTSNPPPTGGGTIPGYTLIYQNGYDTQNDLDPFNHGQLGNGSLSTTIKKDGAGALKSVPANVSSGIRSEVQYDAAQTPLEGIVEYDALYEVVFQSSGHSWQWHPSTSGGSGTGLYHQSGKFVFCSVEQGTTGTFYPTGYTIPQGRWIHIRMDYKFGSGGYIKVIIDGVTLLDRTGIKMGDGSRPYAKHGVNMWVNQSSVVYYDNFKTYKKD